MADDRPPNRSAYPRARPGEPYRNDRERANKARQAAEALFAPKTKPRTGEDAPFATRPAVEKPALTAVPAAPPPAGQNRLDSSPNDIAPRAANPEIPADRVSRIRTWLRYGMTIAEVAAVYGVQIAEIERILRQT